MDNDELHNAKRKVFARQLAQIILDPEQTVIYMDETSFRTWLNKRYTWMHQNEKGRIMIPSTDTGGTTLFGAIGNGLT